MARYIPRLYCPIELSEGAKFTPEQSHYLINVLRVKENDPVIAFNGKDGEWSCAIDGLSKKALSLVVEKKLRPQPSIPYPVSLAFAPLKGRALDFLIEKSVELGVNHLYPVITEHTQGRDFKGDKVFKQVIEACEQCERLTIPVLHKPQKLDLFLNGWNNHPLYVGDERGESPSLFTLIQNNPPSECGILVGPEGGFSHTEFKVLQNHSCVQLMGLGPLTLRAETAALAALSIVHIAHHPR
jgi:16S rRNA (uracil1498-N3)-methyltransferase